MDISRANWENVVKFRAKDGRLTSVDRSPKHIHDRHLTIRWFLGIAGVALLAVSSCTPLSRGDFLKEIEEMVTANPSALVGEWMFSGGVANDTGPYGYNGSVNGAVSTADRIGNPNSAFYFDGVAAHIDLGNGVELNYTDLMSFSCWFRSDDFLTDFGRIVSKRSSPVPAGWEINIGPTDEITTNRAGTNNAKVTNPGMIQGVWHHLAFTWDPNAPIEQIKLYLDGVYLGGTALFAGASQEPPVSTVPLTLGMAAYGVASQFKGAIDDVRFYHGILTAADVAALFAEPALP